MNVTLAYVLPRKSRLTSGLPAAAAELERVKQKQLIETVAFSNYSSVMRSWQEAVVMINSNH